MMMNKVWLILFEENEKVQQTDVFSTREKANEYVKQIGVSEELLNFEIVSRETDPFDVYEYQDDNGAIHCIMVEEMEVK